MNHSIRLYVGLAPLSALLLGCLFETPPSPPPPRPAWYMKQTCGADGAPVTVAAYSLAPLRCDQVEGLRPQLRFGAHRDTGESRKDYDALHIDADGDTTRTAISVWKGREPGLDQVIIGNATTAQWVKYPHGCAVPPACP